MPGILVNTPFFISSQTGSSDFCTSLLIQYSIHIHHFTGLYSSKSIKNLSGKHELTNSDYITALFHYMTLLLSRLLCLKAQLHNSIHIY